MEKSIAAQLKELIETYPGIVDFGLRVDARELDGECYGLYPAGAEKLDEDMAGNVTWQAQFVLQADRFSADDVQRLDNCGWLEDFQLWITALSRKGITLTGARFDSIEARGAYFDAWDPDEQCGTYKVPILLTYETERSR